MLRPRWLIPVHSELGLRAEYRGVCRSQPLAGVRVSDGYRVVVTDSSGGFVIPVGRDSGPFLFTTTPAGYWTNQSFIPITSALVRRPIFELQRSKNDAQYSAVYLTDVHLGEGHAEQSYGRFQATIDEINRLEPLPVVCWVGGDITLQGGKRRHYVELMSGLKTPVRTALGNHELLVREPGPRERFQQLFGPTYYSFDIGRIHYVTLDGCQLSPGLHRLRIQVEGAGQLHAMLKRNFVCNGNRLRNVPTGGLFPEESLPWS